MRGSNTAYSTSTNVVNTTKSAAMTSTQPIVMGKSRVFNASTNNLPMPFQPKIISTNTAPASSEANHPLMVVIMGFDATGKRCLKKTVRSRSPFARAVLIKSIEPTCNRLLRVNCKMTPTGRTPKVKAGKMRFFRLRYRSPL